jgi:hypothetical protein
MVDDRRIYEEEGLEKYMDYQLTNENVILTPGPAFRFVKVLCKPAWTSQRPWVAREGPRKTPGSSLTVPDHSFTTLAILVPFQ